MKFSKTLLIILISLSCFAAPQNREEIKDSISRVSSRIEKGVWRSQATTRNLERANEYLRQAYKLIRARGGDGRGSRACEEYIFNILERTYSSSTAIKKSQEMCKSVADIRVLKYSYSILETIYTDRTAIEKSVSYSDRSMIDKVELLRFTYERFNRTFTQNSSLQRAHEMTSSHQSYHLECFQRYYPRFESRNSSKRALELTSEACINR